MKRLALFAVALSLALPAAAQVRVEGYYRSDGTYVQPHYRSRPDGNPYNNWSAQGNVNPYTGQRGTVNPNPYGRPPSSPGIWSHQYNPN